MKRRNFISGLAALTSIFALQGTASVLFNKKRKGFNFLLLGDLHYDKIEHHDMEYVKRNFPNDVNQILNYSRITDKNLPALLRVVKEQTKRYDADFILQLGDFLEGICGSQKLARSQAKEFIDNIAYQKFEIPFITVKGNHDITGEGAKEVYADTILPWQAKELGQAITSANVSYVHNNVRFILFDCYAKESIEWLKIVLQNHKEDVLFFCTHMPVVPYEARSNWYQYYGDDQKREELLNLLGSHHAIVLSGHLHKSSVVVRSTVQGSFIQVGLCGNIPDLDAPIKDKLKGVEHYSEDLVNLEPGFSPSSVQLRREILKKEAPLIRYYEYADCAGYGLIKITDNHQVILSIFSNDNIEPWTTVNLSDLF